jgi:hypothetical protein
VVVRDGFCARQLIAKAETVESPLDRFALYPPSPKLIIVGTDQPLADWREVMVPNGLMVRTELNQYKLGSSVARLYTRENGVHLDEAGIELITADCEKNPGAVLVLDAFLLLIGPLGLDADSDAAVEPLQNLLESIAPYDISTVVLHHIQITGTRTCLQCSIR